MQYRYSQHDHEPLPVRTSEGSGRAWETLSNLTKSQQLIYLGLSLSPATPLYNMIHASTIRGAVDEEAFALAFQSLVDASDAMRTTIQLVDGVPQQQVRTDMPSGLQIIDLRLESNPDEA